MGILTRLANALGFEPKTEQPEQELQPPRKGMFTTHDADGDYLIDNSHRNAQRRDRWEAMQERLRKHIPKVNRDDSAMDSFDSQGDSSIKAAYQIDQPTMSEAIINWFGAQSFIGAQLCAIIAQHWLVDKACAMPARDALRNGYRIISQDEKELDPKVLAIIKKYDKAFNITWNLEEHIRWARVFGIRVTYFDVKSPDPLYYEKPFNIDGVMPNSYRGIISVDPYWMAPLLDARAAGDPASAHFYEPTWWVISGKKFHRSHLSIYIPFPVADILKPSYLYGGVPLTQRIMERVYAAERTANEGPLLAMTKRTTVYKTNAAQFIANMAESMEKLVQWCTFRDNFQVKVIDKEEDEVELHETSLADLDSVIMTQYQLVCSTADTPSTRMMGTQPKGFNSTGESEEANYHESLEGIQTHGATPMLERHHQLVMKSYVVPKFGPQVVSHEWNTLDVQTAKELAETNLLKAQTDFQLVQASAIDGVDVRDRLINDTESSYTGIAPALRPLTPDDEEEGDEQGKNNNDTDNDGAQEN